MNLKKGFVQMPFLIAIIVGVVVVGGGSYIGLREFQKYQTQQLENGQKSQELILSQQKALEEATKKISSLTKKIIKDTSVQEITATELTPYLNGIIRLDCSGGTGSGSLWNLSIGYIALTNAHVITGNDYCGFWATQIHEKDIEGLYMLDINNKYRWNDDTDIAAVKFDINKLIEDLNVKSGGTPSKPIKELNYGISTLRKCPLTIPIGSPVVLIGYPASTITKVNIQGGYTIQPRTVTNGIISAFDTSVQSPSGNLPHVNYYVSAKIDSGNSGGIAFSKDSNGLCLLGIPTWVSIGNYETQGVIQNIHNIFYQK